MLSGDGCNNLCKVEIGWTCTGGNQSNPDTCAEICGDGINLGFHECDDGNLIDPDGCNSSCKIEIGY